MDRGMASDFVILEAVFILLDRGLNCQHPSDGQFVVCLRKCALLVPGITFEKQEQIDQNLSYSCN
jgi:hypothetical protein